ncbi:MAG: hypothetical protein LBS60_09045 [Deltaproteobacteria bacterium]|jgi:hypothetical protein|nr:hypothetical protein [Deltaproteobacteria bacterium]
MVNLLENKVIAICLIGLIVFYACVFAYQKWKIETLEMKIEATETALFQAQFQAIELNEKLANERAAVFEHSQRLIATDKERREVDKAIDEVCDLRPDWTLPDALYERLRCPAPSYEESLRSGDLLRGGSETNTPAKGGSGVSEVRK